MAAIHLLDAATVNQIAAGEVVERPASIVKELVENSIDAEASSVQIEIREGGMRYIRVTDNGNGIEADQIRTAFLRHSTSKIQSAADLPRILSLGFRGEALASIAAVARVEVLSRTPASMTGVRYILEGGAEKLMEEVACPAGTTVRVENLFFNTPVRKKFLKKPATEASYVTDYVQRIVLGHPEVSFLYCKEGREPSLHSPGNNKLRNSVFAVYGKDILSQLLPLSSPGAIGVEGYISRPQLVRANRSYESCFLNGRYIRSKVIEQALDDAYKDYVAPGSYPVAVLRISMDPSLLDVNVHPTKMEVRFSEEDRVADAVYEAVLSCLKKTDLTARMQEFAPSPAGPGQSADAGAGTGAPGQGADAGAGTRTPGQGADAGAGTGTPSQGADAGTGAPGPAPDIEPGAVSGLDDAALSLLQSKRDRLRSRMAEQVSLESTVREEASPYGQTKDETAPYEREKNGAVPCGQEKDGAVSCGQENDEAPPYERRRAVPPSLRLVGQIFRTYWIAEDRDIFYMIDQHAAHERVLYDRLKEKLSQGELDSQVLLEPMVFQLSPRDAVRVLENTDVFSRLGYRVEAFGEDSVILREVPCIFNGTMGRADFQTMVDLLEEGGRAADQAVLIDKMAMASCKAAVKGNDAISFKEMQSLLEQLFASGNPYNCPHGRPTMMTMTKQELERRFKR